MRFFHAILILALLTLHDISFAADELLDAGRAAAIDVMLDNAIRRGLVSGGVVAVGNHDGILYSTARGEVRRAGADARIDERTLFDVASLTKVIATVPSVMKLLEEGRITLMDPLSRWFPEFEGTGREDITILNLLTHTSGFDDINLAADDPLKSAIHRAASQKVCPPPGNRFRYADINFILLGELVHRSSGQPLNRFSQEHIFAPLGMADTMFIPSAEMAGGIAPTLGPDNYLHAGVVQDENARLLSGVAGHAGLFSSAADLSRFAVMLLGQGRLHMTSVFSPRLVTQMTAPYFYRGGKVIRGLGWDIHSPFSSPRGRYFSDMSFGHTGYSGSSIWVDPELDLFVILLTVRLDYRDVRQFSMLRSDISTLAASIFSRPRIGDEIARNATLP